ncbi:rhodanese-like domain-containing protein [Sulfurimonas sp. SAG-AH-194-C21]|nr:rhodanese-like domain-containing protein [Sulfurimonas sp. SAG-AH-194-C21]MDF1882556.1 rhodanese-like domain-containing protein [Sulfurimonas sp. SAG-AH-194-C21]
MKYFLINTLFSLLVMSYFTGCSKTVDDNILLAAHKAIEKGAVLIDVRTREEYKDHHIIGAINIPVQELVKTLARVPQNKVLVVYCRSGSRSSVAADILSKHGYEVYDVATQSEYNRKIKER